MKPFIELVFSPLLPSFRLFFFFLAAPVLLIAITLSYAIENTAITTSNWSLNQNDLIRAKSIVDNT